VLERSYHCLLCGAGARPFRSALEAHAHIRQAHLDRLEQLDAFPEEFVYVEDTEEELVVEVEFEDATRYCNYCECSFETYKTLVGHLRAEHDIWWVVRGRHWEDDAMRLERQDALVVKFRQRMTIVRNTGDFLVECGHFVDRLRPPPHPLDR
jgi:hypothetical protein